MCGVYSCWMALTPSYYAVALPVAIIIALNSFVFVSIIVSLCRKGKGVKSKLGHLQKIRAHVVVFVLLGKYLMIAAFTKKL